MARGRFHRPGRRGALMAPERKPTFVRRLRFEVCEDRRLLSWDGLVGPEPLASSLGFPLPDNVASNLAVLHQQASAPAATTDLTGVLRSEPSVGKSSESRNDLLQIDARGRPLVDIWTREATAGVLLQLDSLGVEVLGTNDKYRLIEAWLDMESLGTVARLPGVLSLTPVYRPIPRAGLVQTQGDAVLHADDVRAAGYDGSPILVGVLSDSALGTENSQSTGDLPPLVDRYLEFPASDEGRAMLEIVHDLAPGAALAHHSAIFSESSFAQGIRELAAAGARVICDDVGYYSEPFFQDGIIAQAVNEVAAAGVTYVSAAGNDADRSYESDFRDDGTGWHDFDAGAGLDTLQTITVPAASSGYYWAMTLVLQWDQPFYTSAGVTSDFDLVVKDAAGTTVVASGTTSNVATQQPLEVVSWKASGAVPTQYTIGIQHKAGPTSARFKYLLVGPEGTTIDEFSATTAGTIFGHPAASGAIAVGAVPYYAPETIEPFSSQGDVTIYFDAAGSRLASPEIRQKPDVVAPDNVNTTFFGTDIPEDPDTRPNFAGTSAAAPHVAGVAALLLDANPHLTRNELYHAITSTAVDLGTPGRDSIFGFGRVDAAAATTAALATPDVTPPMAIMTSPIPVHGWNVTHIDVQFSEPLDPAVAANPANFPLLGAGVDGDFGTSDDVPYSISATYLPLTRTTTLVFAAPATQLAPGDYRLTLRAAGLVDPAGNPLAGGTDPILSLRVASKSQVAAVEGGTQLDVRSDGTAVMVYPDNPVIHYRWPQVMIGQFGSGGVSQGPFFSAPTDILESWGVTNPDVAVHDAGGVVFYSDSVEPANDGVPRIYAMGYQLIDTQGRPVGSRQVAGYAVGLNTPRVDMNSSGAFVLAFGSRDYDPVSDRYIVFNIKARRFSPSGLANGAVFHVNQASAVSGNPVVAMADDGSSVFAWERSSRIYARRFDPSGNPRGNEFPVDTNPFGVHANPEVAVASDGSFAIVWAESPATVDPQLGSGIFLQRFDASGNRAGEQRRIYATGSNPQVAMTPDGRLVVVWQSGDGDGNGIFAQRLDADGALSGDPLWISEGTTGDQRDPRVAMTDGGDFVVSWSGFARWISWNASGDVAPYGPWIRSQAPSNTVSGSVSWVDVTFDRAITRETFTSVDVQLIDPVGRSVPVTSVTTSDDRTFAVAFPSQQLPGRYRLRVGPDIADLAGRLMDEDGDSLGGEEADAYDGQFVIAPEQAGTMPVIENFESGTVDGLPRYWSFVATETGTIEVTDQNSPRDGYHLKFDQGASGTTTQEAVLLLDLSAQASATDLELDFWLQTLTSTAGVNYGALYVSPDGTNFVPVPNASNLNSSLNQYAHFVFDLDQILRDKGIAIDGDVYVKFVHTGSSPNSEMSIDDVRVSNFDAFGPRIIGQSPDTRVSAPINSISVTFDEPIKASTFTADDVTVLDPVGTIVPLAGDPADSGDQQTFNINFASSQSQTGSYRFSIGPGVADLSGNPMNQDGDIVVGETNGDDRYAGVVQVGVSTGQPVPYVQDFEAGSLTPLADSWSFAVSGTGTIQVTNQNSPHGGTYHLKFDQGASGTATQDAVLLLDLSGQASATDLSLDFWLQTLTSTAGVNYGALYVSPDGTNFVPVPNASNLNSPLNQYAHFVFDLDQILRDKGIAIDGDVHVKFVHTGSNPNSEMSIDDFRVSNVDAFGPRVIGQTPTGQVPGPVQTLSVTFDDPIEPATFTLDDVRVTAPDGRVLELAEELSYSSDQRTFTFSLTTAETLLGIYRVHVGPDIRNVDGTLMNQDGDAINGETSGQDAYDGNVTVGPPTAQAPSLTQGFESWDLGSFPGWSFAVSGTGTIQVTNQNSPHGGAYHLKFDQETLVTTTQEAVLLLDLSGQASATDLALDFWLQTLTSTAGVNYGALYVSPDGTNFLPVPNASNLNSSLNQYSHFVFDLDQILRDKGIAIDGDVYVKFVHTGSNPNSEMTIDDFRVSNVDAFGPRVIGQTPTGQVPGPVQTLSVTFDDPIEPATFTLDDVRVTAPDGRVLELAEELSYSSDQRTFTFSLTTAETLLGIYRVHVGPDIRNVDGTLMNQDGDAINGETSGQDAYDGNVTVGPPMAQAPSVTQRFESLDLGSFPGWSFAVSGTGTIQVTNQSSPHGGAYHLKFDQGASGTTTQEAVLLLDLSAHASATDLELDFWLQTLISYAGTTFGALYVSPDGTNFVPVPNASNLNSPLNQYAHFVFDLDQILRDKGIAIDGDVYVKFVHTGSNPNSEMTIDDFRVKSGPTSVVNRRLFYNRSYFDNNDPAANAADDQAVATDKTALLPGGLASFANYSSYSRGINGLSVDIENLADAAAVSEANFEFRVGNSDTPGDWTVGPAPGSITVRPGAGLGGSDRLTLVWPDGTIRNQWLQITVKADAVTGLGTPDVFYFGNAIGESGDVAGDTLVDGYDVAAAAAHPRGADDPAAIIDPYDFNRDRLVDVADQTLAVDHRTDPDTCLWMLDLREVVLPRVSVSVDPASVAEDGPGRLTYTFTRSGPTDQAAGVTFRVTGTAVFPSDYAASGAAGFDAQVGTVTFAAGSAAAVVTIDPIADDPVEDDETAWLLVLPGADYAVGGPAHAAGTIGNDDTETLAVIESTATATGFTARFGRDLDPSVLNLYDQGGIWGPADMSLVNAGGAAVRGSLVISGDLRQATFITTSGLLEPGTYTVSLLSGDARFRGSDGVTLDGNADGTPGDDFVTTFVAEPPDANAIVVSLPNVTRGYGQPINLPTGNPAAGLPLDISNGLGVSRLEFQLHYDPALLEISAFTVNGALAGGLAQATLTFPAAGVAALSVTAPASFAAAAGPLTVGSFTARVPDTAPYGGKHVLDIADLHVYDDATTPSERPSIDDDAIHVAAYFGDTNGSGHYNSPDAALVRRMIGQVNTGLGAYASADPVLIADITLNGTIQSNDTTNIRRAIGGVSVPNIPPLPTGLDLPAIVGADPKVAIPRNLAAAPGETLTVPVMLEVTEPAGLTIGGFELVIEFDADKFTVGQARLGDLFEATDLVGILTQPAAGKLLFSADSLVGTTRFPFGTVGNLMTLAVTVAADAAPGPAAFNLLASLGAGRTGVFDADLRELVLNPSPTDAASDTVDGILTVVDGQNPWHNAASPFDVNGDGLVTALDALVLINRINA
jgi:hypothetical protein